MTESYPLEFNLPVSVIASLIGKPLKAKMNVKKYKDKIRKLELVEYTIMQTNLDEFKK